MVRLLFLVALLALGTPTAAAQPISLRPGETVIILMDDGGQANVAARGAARARARFEKAAIAAYYDGFFAGIHGSKSKQFGTEDGFPEAGNIHPGVIRLTFRALKRGHRMLLVENGYGRAVAYRAIMKVGKVWRTTDVCQAYPGVRNFEWWPEPIEAIAVSGLKLVAWSEGKAPICE
jgi:hypothetical protein